MKTRLLGVLLVCGLMLFSVGCLKVPTVPIAQLAPSLPVVLDHNSVTIDQVLTVPAEDPVLSYAKNRVYFMSTHLGEYRENFLSMYEGKEILQVQKDLDDVQAEQDDDQYIIKAIKLAEDWKALTALDDRLQENSLI